MSQEGVVSSVSTAVNEAVMASLDTLSRYPRNHLVFVVFLVSDFTPCACLCPFSADVVAAEVGAAEAARVETAVTTPTTASEPTSAPVDSGAAATEGQSVTVSVQAVVVNGDGAEKTPYIPLAASTPAAEPAAAQTTPSTANGTANGAANGTANGTGNTAAEAASRPQADAHAKIFGLTRRWVVLSVCTTGMCLFVGFLLDCYRLD